MSAHSLLRTALAAALLAALAGCGPQAPAPSTADDSPSAAAAPAPTPAQPETPVVTLPPAAPAAGASAPARKFQELPLITAGAKRPDRLVRIATIDGVESNQQFQRNVQLINAQRNNLAALQQQLAASRDPAKQRELRAQVQQAAQTLEENNRKMTEAYGFSLLRDYLWVYEKAQLWTPVTDEEAERIQEEERKLQQPAPSGQ